MLMIHTVVLYNWSLEGFKLVEHDFLEASSRTRHQTFIFSQQVSIRILTAHLLLNFREQSRVPTLDVPME